MHFTPVAASIFSLLVIVSLILVFVMLGSRWLKNYLIAFTAQCWVIACISAGVAYYGHYPELYVVAAFTALFRGMVLPYLVLRIMRRMHIDRELHEIVRPSTALLVGVVLVILALVVARAIGLSLGNPSDIIVLAITVMLSIQLIGFLMLSVRHEAISQILGLLMLENGLFLGSQILVPGMPLLLELVILFDLLVAVACFSVLINFLVTHVGTTSSLQLRRLRG